jgi:CCL2 lectin-like
MAQIVLPNFYFIINRVLSPSGAKLAAQYNGPDNKVTLEPFNEANKNQRVSSILPYATRPVYLTYLSFRHSGC